MPNFNTCHPVTVANNGSAHVQCCPHCGCISVHLGPISLRLEAEGLESLSSVLGEAATELRLRRGQWGAGAASRGVA